MSGSSSVVGGPPDTSPKPVYVFLDEGGDLNFSPSGSRFFSLTSVLVHRPFPTDTALTELRFDLIETGLNIEYFHASEDRQATRDKVFAIIQTALQRFRVDSVIVEKRKTGPSLRADNRFYPEMIGYLLKFVVERCDLVRTPEVIVITDRIPINRKREAVEKAVKMVLTSVLPNGVQYRVLHHDSKSSVGLQIADYFNWAIFRAWEREDRRSLDIVRSAVRSQFEIFRRGKVAWY